MQQELIPFTEVEVPENWNYDESVKKMQPLVRKWTEMSYGFFLELKIARKALAFDQKEAGQRRTGQYVRRSWTEYCIDIGITQRHANRLLAEYFEEPFLYNVWNMPRGDDEEYFGHFPYRFMRNLLYYHTRENDLIYDPFAGSGVTVDVCEEMGRRYYCSDLFPQRDTIRQWDVAFGLPDDLPQIDFAFLDPPYWKQAEGKYSEDKRDISNTPLDQFYSTLDSFVNQLSAMRCKVAIVISPTQWRNENHRFEHHMAHFIATLYPSHRIVMDYSLPYSTQQYNGNQVEIAKAERIPLVLTRQLCVWEPR